MIALLACTGPTVSVEDSVPEADADTDADADADADTDSDTDLPDWYLFKASLDAELRDGELVDGQVEATFYPSGWSQEEPGGECTWTYDIADAQAEGLRWRLGLEGGSGDCVPGLAFDPAQDVDRLIVGIDSLTWDLEEDLAEAFDDWDQAWKPWVFGSYTGIDTVRENGWAFVLEVDDQGAPVPGTGCAVTGASCLDHVPSHARLRTWTWYFLFLDF